MPTSQNIISPLLLLVDDMPDNLKILLNIFKEYNYKVAIANNGKQAVETAIAKIPDLILLDIQMPEMDGYEACRLIKANPQTAHVPILFLTAHNEPSDIVKGFELGAVDYVVKPFKHDELLARVRTHLELKFSREKLLSYTAELERLNTELNITNAAKDKFFSILSHDLKRPFNGIFGFVTLLIRNVRKYPIEKIEHQLKLVEQSAKNAYSLLENLLDWSRAQTGRIDFEPQNILIYQCINDTVALYQTDIITKNITINVNVDEEIKIFADQRMVYTIFRNLISNAIKYCHKDKGVIIVEVNNSKLGYTFSISDNGVGIEQTKIESLFSIENIRSLPGTDNEVGTGLGLIICYEFVAKHNGKIWVESKLSEGSIFKFFIPHNTPQ